jgi:hypothetical protein
MTDAGELDYSAIEHLADAGLQVYNPNLPLPPSLLSGAP